MKPRCSHHRNYALTLVEVLITVVILGILTVMLLPDEYGAKRKAPKIACTNNLKQMGLAMKIWESDNNDKLPMDVSVTNGGAMELVGTPDAWKVFLVMSNELGTPKILYCPADSQHGSYATKWGEDLKNKISYFIGLNDTETNPAAFVSGDDNFEIDGAAVKSGLIELSSNTPINWTTGRHNKTGNILLGDGSVQGTTSHSLRALWQQTDLATNRIFIP